MIVKDKDREMFVKIIFTVALILLLIITIHFNV